MYELKIAGTDQVSFGPVPVLMVVKIIWSTAYVVGTQKSRLHILYTIFTLVDKINVIFTSKIGISFTLWLQLHHSDTIYWKHEGKKKLGHIV